MSWGIVIKDEGVVRTAVAKRFHGRFDVETVELLAIKEGLKLAESWGIPIYEAESDSLRAIQGIISDIKRLCEIVSCGSCQFVFRNDNNLAHLLANYTLLVILVICIGLIIVLCLFRSKSWTIAIK